MFTCFLAFCSRIRNPKTCPKTTALIFASGKMVITGAKSEDDSQLVLRKYAHIVQKLGFEAKFSVGVSVRIYVLICILTLQFSVILLSLTCFYFVIQVLLLIYLPGP